MIIALVPLRIPFNLFKAEAHRPSGVNGHMSMSMVPPLKMRWIFHMQLSPSGMGCCHIFETFKRLTKYLLLGPDHDSSCFHSSFSCTTIMTSSCPWKLNSQVDKPAQGWWRSSPSFHKQFFYIESETLRWTFFDSKLVWAMLLRLMTKLQIMKSWNRGDARIWWLNMRP